VEVQLHTISVEYQCQRHKVVIGVATMGAGMAANLIRCGGSSSNQALEFGASSSPSGSSGGDKVAGGRSLASSVEDEELDHFSCTVLVNLGSLVQIFRNVLYFCFLQGPCSKPVATECELMQQLGSTLPLSKIGPLVWRPRESLP
jgi:hypothetical protein